MPKHVLFLVHGAGVHKPYRWSESIIQKIKETSQRYAYFRKPNSHIENKVEFVPVNYDHVLSEIIESWQHSAHGLSIFAGHHSPELNHSLLWLENAGEKERNLFWSYIADIIIYRFFPDHNFNIRNIVLHQLTKKISELTQKSGSVQYSLLTHCLGTAVVQDCLNMPGNREAGEATAIYHATGSRFHSLFMIADSSGILRGKPEGYSNPVSYGEDTGKKSYCRHYYTFRHEYDPFTNASRFDTDVRAEGFVSCTLNHLHCWDVHSVEHYLDNPSVHIPILRKLAGPKKISKEEEINAILSYGQFSEYLEPDSQVKNQISNIKRINEKLRMYPDLSTTTRYFIEFLEIQEILKRYSRV